MFFFFFLLLLLLLLISFTDHIRIIIIKKTEKTATEIAKTHGRRQENFGKKTKLEKKKKERDKKRHVKLSSLKADKALFLFCLFLKYRCVCVCVYVCI